MNLLSTYFLVCIITRIIVLHIPKTWRIAWKYHWCSLTEFRVSYLLFLKALGIVGPLKPLGGLRPLGRSSYTCRIMQSKWETIESSSYLLQPVLSVCENTQRLCGCQSPLWHSQRLNKQERAGFKGTEMMAGDGATAVREPAPGGTGCTNNSLLFKEWFGNRSHMLLLHYSLLFKYKALIG